MQWHKHVFGKLYNHCANSESMIYNYWMYTVNLILLVLTAHCHRFSVTGLLSSIVMHVLPVHCPTKIETAQLTVEYQQHAP